MSDDQREMFGTVAQARHTDPFTSKQAAAHVDVSRIELAVLAALKRVGDRGANWYELESLTNIDKGSLSPRFAPLRLRRLIELRADPATNKATTRTGSTSRRQIVWFITKLGMEKLK